MRRSQWAVTLVPIVIGLVTNIASGALPPSPWLVLAWPVLCLLWLAWTLIDYRHSRVRDRAHPTPVAGAARVTAAVGALHEAVHAQWTGEAEIRGLSPAEPLPLTWTTTKLPGFPPVADAFTVRPAQGEPRLIGLRGGIADLLRTFVALRHRHLTVLGEPGAGKSALALLFTLHLLQLRQQDDTLPVPMLLSLSSWRPHEEHLRAWVARRMAEDYPALGDVERFGADVAATLLREGRLVLVLDALDELPESWHAAAVRHIDKAIGAPFPAVLTCRSDAYRTVVREHGVVSATALVVEIEKVRTAEAVRFLAQGRSTDDAGWQPLLSELDRHPGGILAQALRTPLTVALLKRADPSLDPDRFADPEAIEKHLLATFVPAAYARPGPLPPGTKPPPPSPFPAMAAQRWLTTIAVHLVDRGGYEVRWWQLYELAPQRPLRVFAGILAGSFAAAALTTAAWLMIGATDTGAPDAALLAGVVGGALLGSYVGVADRSPDQPSRLHLRSASPAGGRRPRGARRFGATLRGGLTAGLATGLVAQATYSAAFGVSDTGPLALMLGLMFGAVAGLALGISGWLGQPADCVEGPAPLSLLRSDRAFTLLRLGLFAAIFGVVAGVAAGSVAGADVGLRNGLAAALLGLVVALARGLGAWGWFVLARVWLAVRRRTPWRLLAFLDDAHTRGVLRRAGGVYEFRHSTLRDQLAGTSSVPAPEAAPTMVGRAPKSGRRTLLPLRARLATVPAAALATLVAGMFLGAGLPVIASPQADCGGLFDTDVRLLRDGLTSECVGVTDGSVVFDRTLAEVQHRILQENVLVARQSRKHVQVALLTPMTAAPDAPADIARIRHSLEGAYIAQQKINTGGGAVAVQLVLANAGSRQSQWQPVVRQLIDRADDSNPLVAVIGLGLSTARAAFAAEQLHAAGIPLIAATTPADVFGAHAGSGIASAAGSTADAVRELRRVVDLTYSSRRPVLVVADTDTDPYSRTTASEFRRQFPQPDEPVIVVERDSAFGRGPSYDDVRTTVCSARASHVLYAGPPPGLPALMQALSNRSCTGTTLTVLATATTLPDAGLPDTALAAAGLQLIALTRAEAGPVTRPDLAPPALRELVRQHGYVFGRGPDAFSDGAAILHHDALQIAAAAIRLTVAEGGPLTARAVLGHLDDAQLPPGQPVRPPSIGPLAGTVAVLCRPRTARCPRLPEYR
ncbi:NACHT domain-containing protein [Actinoplanes sp. NPDC048967]|uniref:NACHT domain-containing protein n=1 Tax=Actinoplanes sp. NPDC048967 TaxID=3155269 RepID=UPI0033E4675D